jgi:hypothetical protein
MYEESVWDEVDKRFKEWDEIEIPDIESLLRKYAKTDEEEFLESFGEEG